MAASDGLLPSLPLPLCVSFECVVGEMGPRRFVATLPLETTGFRISIGIEDVCEALLALTLSFVDMFSSVAYVLRAANANLWVCYFETGQ